MTLANEVDQTSLGPALAARRGARARRRRAIRLVERLAAPVFAAALLLAWQVLVDAAHVSEFVLPPPSAILARMLSDRALLLSHAGTTALEVLGGFLMSAVVGVALALAIFYSRLVEVTVYPILVALQTVPKVALAPLIVLYLGYGWGPKLFLSFIVSFFAVVVTTVIGLRGLDPGYADLARSMGASEAQIFAKIRLPAALPTIMGSLKVALTLAVIGAVLGEYVASERGLGYVQLQANASFDTTLNFASVVAIAWLGVVLYGLLLLVERSVVPQGRTGR